MTESTNSEATEQRQHFPAGILPENPTFAILTGLLFKQLGGILARDVSGRMRWLPEPVVFRMNGEELPQMPEPEAHERFHNADEWRGALKLADYLLVHLDDADKELVFEMLAPLSIDPEKPFDFREYIR